MLTVRYERLGVQPGDRLLDLGSGLGRHAYEAARVGATVVAVDLAADDLQAIETTFWSMAEAGEPMGGHWAGPVVADAVTLPFPDATFDRVIAAEVFEHIADDGAAMRELARVVRPGGTIAVTVPAYLPERICWALSSDYHAPAVPGGHVRIYRTGELRSLMGAAGLRPDGAHRAHALHSPYWWLRCAVGPDRDDHAAVRAYRKVLEWDIVRRPWITQNADRVLNPVLGKSIVVYASRPQAA